MGNIPVKRDRSFSPRCGSAPPAATKHQRKRADLLIRCLDVPPLLQVVSAETAYRLRSS